MYALLDNETETVTEQDVENERGPVSVLDDSHWRLITR